MIISFVIFITFIVFLYVVVNPAVSTGESKKSVLDYIDSKITENVSANFTTASVDFTDANNPSNKYCVKLENLLLLLSMYQPNIVVKNATENVQEAYEETYNLKINRKTRSNRFFKIYHSPEFDRLSTNTALDCNTPASLIHEVDYVIGSITVTKYAFERSLYELIDYYKTDYDKLKRDLTISPGSEFGFDFVQANGTVIGVGEPEKSVSIYAEEIPIQYVDNKANILSGFINIKVW